MKAFEFGIAVALYGILFLRLRLNSLAAVASEDAEERGHLIAGSFLQDELTDWRFLSHGSSRNSLVTDIRRVNSNPSYSGAGEERGTACREPLDVRIKLERDEGNAEELEECGAALLQGWRRSQEDRVLCVPDILLPRFGSGDVPVTKVGLFAVFDGHGGDEASHLASESLHQRFVYHLYASVGSILSDTVSNPRLPSAGKNVGRRHNSSPGVHNASGHLQESESISQIPPSATGGPSTDASVEAFEHSPLGKMLKEALSRAIMDLESTFLTEALRTGLQSGTTACVVLQAGNHLLVASVGDSKALLCPASVCAPLQDVTRSDAPGSRRAERQKRRTNRSGERNAIAGVCESGPAGLELTRDHRPDREEEKLRVENSGGFVESRGGVPRVNGKLAVSRSIGDVAFKKYGVIAEPEWSGWLNLRNNDSYLIIASDGVFEKLSTDNVCRALSAVQSGMDASVALGLVRELAIALPPRKEPELGSPVKESLEPSRAVMAIAENTIGSKSNQPTDMGSEALKSDAQDTDGNGQGKPKYSAMTNSDTLTRKYRMVEYIPGTQQGGPENPGTGCEVVPVSPKVPARVFAKAIVDAAFSSGSMDNMAAVVVPLKLNVRYSSDTGVEDTIIKRSTAHNVPETVRNSVPLTVDSRAGLQNEIPANLEGNVVLMSGTLVKGFADASCYELIDTVMGSKILPRNPVVEYKFSEEFTEALKPTVETLPAGAAHAGIAGGKLEVYREHLICTPRFVLEGNHKEVCLPPEGLLRFLNLIGSVPLDKQALLPAHWDTGGRPMDSKMVPPYSVNHHRYMLQKNFARGAFGEIWLAVKRPCLREEAETRDLPYRYNIPQRNITSSPQDTHESLGGKCDTGKPSAHKGWSAGGHFSYDDTFILKRILVEKGGSAYLSGLREKYFGQLFLNESIAAKATRRTQDSFISSSSGCGTPNMFYWKAYCKFRNSFGFYAVANASNPEGDVGAGLDHIARYVESFELPGNKDLWLVFHNEGKSLSSLLYTARSGGDASDEAELGGFKVLQPSPWWRWLKTTDAGRSEMRSIIHQLVLAVKACHDHNITHRDIKPENMIVSTKATHANDWPSNLTMRLIDFGSAMDQFTLKHLYGSSGPSQAEQTVEYSPPEATLSKHWLHFHAEQAHVYDLWSVGIVMLELVLGTPHVFQVSARTRVLLDRQLQGMDESARETIYMLRAYLEMCILLPGIPPNHHNYHHSDTVDQAEEVRLAAWKCTEESLIQQIQQRDPLGIGMPDVWALRLLRQLLQWYPEDRISAAEALQHPYFHPTNDK